MVELVLGNQIVKIDAGELVSYKVDGHEYIHQKGSQGWRNSDTEMFPVIGPMAAVDFEIDTPKGKAIQDQHGLLRELNYELGFQSNDAAFFTKEYKAKTKVGNSKYPKKSSAKELYWPYSFTFQKIFELKKNGLEILFKVSGEEGMPFMLGYHPAFKLYIDNPLISAKGKTITLAEIVAVGNRAFQVADCDTILLKDQKEIKITTEGFGDFMLWTEVPNMVCIEPITFYPYGVDPKDLKKGFEYISKSEKIFMVNISVG
ncbi:MAG: aldose 1-epimerase [Flavobacteriaceae bacterium]